LLNIRLRDQIRSVLAVSPSYTQAQKSTSDELKVYPHCVMVEIAAGEAKLVEDMDTEASTWQPTHARSRLSTTDGI